MPTMCSGAALCRCAAALVLLAPGLIGCDREGRAEEVCWRGGRGRAADELSKCKLLSKRRIVWCD